MIAQALYSIMILLDCDVLVHYLIRCIATDTIINLYGFYVQKYGVTLLNRGGVMLCQGH